MKQLIAILLVAFTAGTFAAEPTNAPERKKVTPDFSKKKEKKPAKKPTSKPVPAPKQKPATVPAN